MTSITTNNKRRSAKQISRDKEIGERISSRCRERKIHSVELAKRMGLSKSNIDDYRSGRSSIPSNRLEDLCSELKCDANYLINGNEDVKRKTGLSDKACRMLTGIIREDAIRSIESDENHRYILGQHAEESTDEFDTRSREALVEIQGTLSWFIEHGLIGILAELCDVQSVWESKLKNKDFIQVAMDNLNYPSADEKYVYENTLKIVQKLEFLIQYYVSKSSDFEGR